MGDKVDAVVVGAGLGGLSAAACLARGGLRVLVLERHNIPGGYATSFVRGRFEFEVALHELSGIGSEEHRGPIYRYLEAIGVAQRCTFVQAPTLYRSVFPGVDLTLPHGFDAARQVLCDAFGGDAAGISSFLTLVRDLARELARMQRAGHDKLQSPLAAAQVPLRYPTLFRYQQAAFGPVLRRHVTDPHARAVLSQLWGYFGLPPDLCSFFWFALGLSTYLKYGACYVEGRSQTLSQAFVDAIEEQGGQVRFGCGASSITTEGGRVTGVVTDEGQTVRAPWVVSNADPLTTCAELVGRQHVPAAFFRSLQSTEVAASSFNVYLGLAATAQQLGLTDHEIFVQTDMDFERQYRDSDGLQPPAMLAITTYNHVYPEISEPGTTLLVLTSLNTGQPWHAVRPQDYLQTKHRMAEGMLRLAEQVVPDLRRYAEVVEVSTPVTNMRYTGNPGGSIYGSSHAPGRHTVWRVPQRGPLRGLYFSGAWTQPGGGFEPVMASGQQAGEAILHKLGKRLEYPAEVRS